MRLPFAANSVLRRRNPWFLGLFIGVLMLTVSCSDGRGDELSGGDDDASNQRGVDEVEFGVPKELAADSEGYGHRLKLGLIRPPSYRPDEVVLTDQSAVIVSDLLYDGLTEATGATGELRPGLAIGWESDDRYVDWRFHLDPSAGVSATDVVNSLDRLSNGEGGRAGISAALAADIAVVEAIDDLTVRIELRGPNAGLPWVLSGIPYSISSDAGGVTGDYEVTSDDTNGMILSRRTGRELEGRIAPDEVVVTWAAPVHSSQELLQSGLVDVAVLASDAAFDGVEGGADGLGIAGSRTIVTTSAVRFYVLNSQAGSLAEIDSRRAVFAAINRDELMDLGLDQSATPIDGLLGSAMVGYQLDACGKVCDHQAAAADGGGVDPSSLRLQISFAGDEQRVTAAAIAEQLSAAGIEAEQSELEPEELAEAIVAGHTDMFAFGWVAPATSGDAVLPPLLAVESPANVARIASPEVERLLGEASITADDQARWALLDQAHRAALAEALILPIGGSTSILVATPAAPAMAVRADGSIDLDSLG